MTDTTWTANLERLKKFEVDYPAFWAYLTKIAAGIAAHRGAAGEYLTLDDHLMGDKTRPITMIGICYIKDKDGNLVVRPIEPYEWHPPAWCFYFHPNTTCQCKNSLHCDQNGHVHTIQAATGHNLEKPHFDLLKKGQLLTQGGTPIVGEYTFALPIEQFIACVLAEPSTPTTEIETSTAELTTPIAETASPEPSTSEPAAE